MSKETNTIILSASTGGGKSKFVAEVIDKMLAEAKAKKGKKKAKREQ